MCVYIGIEDLAANALIFMLKQSDTRFVSYEKIEKYGSEVVRILSDKNEEAVLLLSRDSTYAMFRNYSDFFEEKENNNKLGISLKQDVGVKDLINAFRGYLAWDVLMAFIDKRAIETL